MYQNKVFFKIIFDITISKQFENIKKNFILRKKNQNFWERGLHRILKHTPSAHG